MCAGIITSALLKIGGVCWDHFFCARVVLLWSIAQNSFLRYISRVDKFRLKVRLCPMKLFRNLLFKFLDWSRVASVCSIWASLRGLLPFSFA